VRRPAATAIPAATAAALAITLALGHGASKGLHLHVHPDPAARGAVVTADVDADEAVRRLRIGFVGGDPLSVRLDPPTPHTRIEIEVPVGGVGDTINLQAEAVTVSGRVLRASAVVRLTPPPESAP